MAKLHEWDDVAYVRFASVYRQFKDPGDFVQELKELAGERKREGKSPVKGKETGQPVST